MVAYDRIGIPYTAYLSKATLIKIGQELDAGVLVLGEVLEEGGNLKVTSSVLDLERIWESQLMTRGGDKAHLQELCNGLAWEVLRQISPEFTASYVDYSRGIPLLPPLAIEYYIRGLMESDLPRQIYFFREADQAYPNYQEAIFELGSLYFRENDYATSALWLERLENLGREGGEASFLLGLDYLYLKNYEKATQVFFRLSERIPVNEVNCNLGIALSGAGKVEEATAAFRKALASDPGQVDCLFNLAYHYWKNNNLGGALRNTAEVLKRDRMDADAYYLQYRCFQTISRTAEAEKALATARELNPRVESWEGRQKVPDLFRIQTRFNEAGYRQLQLELQQVMERKGQNNRTP
jgi:tetratricopeptide (TPR) repeat protein